MVMLKEYRESHYTMSEFIAALGELDVNKARAEQYVRKAILEGRREQVRPNRPYLKGVLQLGGVSRGAALLIPKDEVPRFREYLIPKPLSKIEE